MTYTEALLLGYALTATVMWGSQARDSWRVFKCGLITTSVLRYVAQHLSNMCTLSLIDADFAKREITKVHEYLTELHEMTEKEILASSEEALLKKFRDKVER